MELIDKESKGKSFLEKAKKTTAEKKLDTIENPHNNHTIGDLGGSWTTPLKNCQGAMF